MSKKNNFLKNLKNSKTYFLIHGTPLQSLLDGDPYQLPVP